jgi:NADPH:quinone reductase-like Zn-dependent oxidoreductase
MKAVRVHSFGPPQTLVLEDVSNPAAGPGEVLVRVEAAGVGPWDALIRSGKSVSPPPLPLTPGGELSGVVEFAGPGVHHVKAGDEIFGATNKRFTGAYAHFAVADAGMIAPKPGTLNHTHAASVPVAAVMAWQLVCDCAGLTAGQSVLIHGGAGSVGGFAVQFARRAGTTVIATASGKDAEYVRSIGGVGVIDYRAGRFEDNVKEVDAVIDTVGGETLDRSYEVVKRGGIVVSASTLPSEAKAHACGVRTAFIPLEVTAERLTAIAELIDAGRLKTEVGEVLWLHEACQAHEMLEGAPHRRGKIVIRMQQ